MHVTSTALGGLLKSTTKIQHDGAQHVEMRGCVDAKSLIAANRKMTEANIGCAELERQSYWVMSGSSAVKAARKTSKLTSVPWLPDREGTGDQRLAGRRARLVRTGQRLCVLWHLRADVHLVVAR